MPYMTLALSVDLLTKVSRIRWAEGGKEPGRVAGGVNLLAMVSTRIYFRVEKNSPLSQLQIDKEYPIYFKWASLVFVGITLLVILHLFH